MRPHVSAVIIGRGAPDVSAGRTLLGARLRSERNARRLTIDALAEAFRENASERDRRHLPKLRDLRG
jgi:hypothetical protein